MRVQKKLYKYLKEQSSMIEYKISQKAIFMKEKNKEIGKIPKIEENEVINKVGVYQWQKK